MGRRLISVDARGYFTGGGIGRYTRSLVAELAAAASGRVRLRFLISNRHRPEEIDLAVDGVEVVVSRAEWMHADEEDRFLEAEVAGSDLFHSLTGHWLPSRTPSVATLLDFTPLMRPSLVSPAARQTAYRIASRLPVATHIIAISESTAADARHLLGPHLPPISVIPLAAAPPFHATVRFGDTLNRCGLEADEFILTVSALNTHKNIGRLIEAYAVAKIEPPLVIAGAHRDATEIVQAAIRRHRLEHHVCLLGRVCDDDLAALYAACRLFVFPSLYEGFGLPVIEAMACGTPVITSNRSSLPEVTGDAALTVDVSRTLPLANALKRLNTDASLRHELRRRALARAATFSWTRTAAETLDVYDRALEARAVA